MSVKLYKHNDDGETVAAILSPNFYILFDKDGHSFYKPKYYFEQTYTPLPEVPEVGSRAWQLYEAPNPIVVECLPHEFVRGDIVLVRDGISKCWNKREFVSYEHTQLSGAFYIKPHSLYSLCDRFNYCIPYAENSHLEGMVTDGEHGEVPEGYVPPHVPKLGDEDYWQKGDEAILISSGREVFINLYEECPHVLAPYELQVVDGVSIKLPLDVYFDNHGRLLGMCEPKGLLRILYHKGSYVREDGTVHEHVPTRTHKIK